MIAVSRRELVSFIEQAIRSAHDMQSWERIMVNHYRDAEMEHARRECVRILGIKSKGDWSMLTEPELEHLKSLAASL